MAYTAATILPISMKRFQWGTPTDPNPRLASPISDTDTTIVFTSTPYDYDGTTPITGHCLIGIKNEKGYVETIYCPPGSISGATATGVVRGVRLTGLDYTTAGTGLAVSHGQDSAVMCNISAVDWLMMVNAFAGNLASGGTTWKIGDGTDQDIYVYAYNADGNKPFWKYDKTTNQWLYSNDGVNTTPFGTGAGVTGGDGITVTAGDIDIDLTDTTIFKDSRTGNEKRAVATEASSGLINSNFLPTNLQAIASTGTTNVTGTELETLSDGSVASGLHYHDKKVGTISVSISPTAATGNNDITVTTSGTPRIIILDFQVVDAATGAGHPGLLTRSFYNGSTIASHSYFFNADSNTTLTLRNYAVSTSADPTGGALLFGSGGNDQVITFSIQSLSSTGCVIRFTNTKHGTGGGSTAITVFGSYEVIC